MKDSIILSELAPQGRLRVAINYGNPVLAQKDDNGRPKGISAKLAQALASELKLDIDWITFESAGRVFASVDEDCWDIAFLAIDPLRAEKISFSQPYVTIAGTYLVAIDSTFKTVADLDKGGITVSVGRGAAYDLYLSRTLQHAEILRGETSQAAINLFADHQSDAAAGVRQPLQEYADANGSCRVIEDDFTNIHQAMAVSGRREAAAAYISDFIIRKKQEGFIESVLLANGQPASLAAK